MTDGVRLAGEPAPMAAQAAYDLTAPFYDQWAWQTFWRAREYPFVREALARFRRGRGRPLNLLDVGCGTGWYLDALRDLSGEQAGVDVSRGMLAVARRRLVGAVLWHRDARGLPFADGRFDAVVCTRVLSHLPQVGAVVGEMRRTLVAGGMLVLSDVDARHDYEFTRLPLASGHVLAETYKHDRDEIFEAVADAGFVADRAALIHSDGTVDGGRHPASGPAPVVGWVAAWRRAENVRS